MALSNQYIASNGLRISGRTSQSISLAWPSIKVEKVIVNDNDNNSDVGEGVTDEELGQSWNNDGNWFEVQMRTGGKSATWASIYKGYGCQCEVDGLPPDSELLFRMKRNLDVEWGSEISASTEPSPATTEDLNRAVEMNSTDLISRILKLTKPSHLSIILKARDRNGMTPLMVACHTGNVTIAKKLIRAGSDINAFSSNTQRTPLIIACIMGREGIVAMLDKKQVDWKTRDECGCNALDYSINGGYLNIIKLACTRLGPQSIHERGPFGWPPLMRASILCENIDVVRFLLSKGADINATDKPNSKSVLMSAIIAKKPKLVLFLLGQGANPSYENQSGNSCLQVAKSLEYREITEIITKACEADTLQNK